MKTLHLVLKSKWFDKIASGEKTSEYRECKQYWNNRFAGWKYPAARIGSPLYEHVVFHKGYTNKTMEFEILSIDITTEKNDLDLPQCWEIKLGKRMNDESKKTIY